MMRPHDHYKSATIILVFLLSLCTFLFPLITSAQNKTMIDEIRQDAERLVNQNQLGEAISLYESFINQYPDYGEIHLRLGQLYLKRKKKIKETTTQQRCSTLATYHFLRCLKDQRVSQFMRDHICQRKLSKLASPLLIKGSYHRLLVDHPDVFRGEVKANDLLPHGLVELSVLKTANAAPQKLKIVLPMRQAIDLGQASTLPARPQFKNVNFTISTAQPSGLKEKPRALFIDEKKSQSSKISTIPGFVMGSVGLVSIGLASYFYVERSNDPLTFNREYPSDLPLYLMIPGAILTGIGTGWLVWTW